MSEERAAGADMLPALRARLEADGLTCIVRCGDKVLTSTQRGIRPLLDWIAQGEDVAGGAAADRIVGKAAALMYVLMGVREVYAGVLSESGLAVLRGHGVRVCYGELTPRIINRAGTGLCPMEETVLAVSDPAEAYAALRRTAQRLAEGGAPRTCAEPEQK